MQIIDSNETVKKIITDGKTENTPDTPTYNVKLESIMISIILFLPRLLVIIYNGIIKVINDLYTWITDLITNIIVYTYLTLIVLFIPIVSIAAIMYIFF